MALNIGQFGRRALMVVALAATSSVAFAQNQGGVKIGGNPDGPNLETVDGQLRIVPGIIPSDPDLSNASCNQKSFNNASIRVQTGQVQTIGQNATTRIGVVGNKKPESCPPRPGGM